MAVDEGNVRQRLLWEPSTATNRIYNNMTARSIVLSLLCIVSALGQPAFEARVKSHLDKGDFIGSVLVAQDGKVLYRSAVGMAQAEWGIPNTPETKFRLGSITKQFTAVAVLQLVEKGKIKLDDPVKKYYAEAPASWDTVTIHHLLNHTSGIPSYTEQPGFFEKGSMLPMKAAEIVKLTQDKPLEFPPGSKFHYDNTGYVLLGAILETVTGKPYGDHMREVIFDPLGMKDTGYDVSSLILKNRAAGYQRGKNGLENARYLDMTLPHAAGALYSTVDDLLKWDQALYTEKLINAASRQKMLTPGLDGYGYGWALKKEGAHSIAEHGGGINGFSTHILRVLDEKIVVITLANMSTPGAGKLAQELAKLAMGIPLPEEPKEIQIPPEKLNDYPGVYPLSPQFSLTVRNDRNQLTVQGTGQPANPVFAYATDKFFAKVVDAQMEFTRGSDGKVDGVILHQGGRDLKAPRQQ